MRLERTCRVVLALLAFDAFASAQADNAPAPGQKLPDFALQDQSGRRRNFADIRGPRGAMIVFYRSADW